jgi:DNA polymerase-3 subunit chi
LAAAEVWFYHLERTPLERALPELLEKTLARGWRALVRTGDLARMEPLDTILWTYRDDSFLPHGRADAPDADRQPVLLTTEAENANEADVLFLIDGAEPGELDGYKRCVLMFDGRDEGELAAARARWAAFRRAGLELSYWKQEPSGWTKQDLGR